jgi:ribosomal protein S18 acetylase RimI-like enzyme
MMSNSLNNPIWVALNTGSATHAEGNDRVKYMHRDKGLFVGFKNFDEDAWKDISDWLPEDSQIILFTAETVNIPPAWEIKANRQILQMVYESNEPPDSSEDTSIVSLSSRDIPAMLDLTARTKPGPFLSKTFQLGHYQGIFDGEKLVAMSGQRLRPDPYVEISAVCTDPGYVGRGFAGELVQNQVRCILAESRVPFLHLNADNYRAIKLYEKIGFRLTQKILLNILQKAG